MTDESIDLAATAPDETKNEVRTSQFKRDLSHILIHETGEGETAEGPLLTVGKYNLQFKKQAPVGALVKLIEGGLEGMRQYVNLSLEDASKPDFDDLLNHVDVEGLGEILSALGEGYTSFPAQS